MSVLQSGVLQGNVPGMKKWRRYYLEVTPTYLHIYDENGRKLLRSLEIDRSDICGEDTKYKREFRFYLLRGDGKYIFGCDRPEERRIWLEQLQRVIEVPRTRLKKSALDTPLPAIPGSHSPRLQGILTNSGYRASKEVKRGRHGIQNAPARAEERFMKGTGASLKSRDSMLGLPPVQESGENYEKCKWFWGTTSRLEAERRLLAEGKMGNFVVRINATGHYIMTYWRKDGVHHHMVINHGTIYRFEKSAIEGKSLVDLLDTYIKRMSSKARPMEPFGGTLHELYNHAGTNPALEILKHPENTISKPGRTVEFQFKTSPEARTHEWHFNDRPILISNNSYEGSATSNLLVKKALSKHKGDYKCIATDDSGRSYTSKSASLIIETGERIKEEECKLLGRMLQTIDIDLKSHGIDIQLLLEGRSELSYEELQLILSEIPSTRMLAKNLKQELSTRLEEERLYHIAMDSDRKVSLSYTKILALGPGQVGKSTFLYRLMGLKKLPQCSTGIAELHEAFISYSSSMGALTEESWQIFDKSSDLKSQLGGLIHLLIEQTPCQPVEEHDRRSTQTTKLREPSTVSPTAAKTVDTAAKGKENLKPVLQEMKKEVVKTGASTETQLVLATPITGPPLPPQQTNIDKVVSEFESIKTACMLGNKTKFHMLFNIVDVGGQPAFLEMLPSLTIGPALYLVFMKLMQGLNTRYEVAFKCKNERGSILCSDYTYTSEEVIFTALSSIACFGHSDEEVEMYVAKEGKDERKTSLALLVGTFADKVESEELDEIDRQLKKHLEKTDFYEDGLIYDVKFERVNNMSTNEEDIKKQRKLLKEILQKKFRKYEIPTRWLTLSICLKLLARMEEKYEVSLEDCVKLGKRFGMEEDMVRVALQFLHKYIGLVMFFPKHPALQNVVICDPQVVFSSISELIFDVYDPKKMYITTAQHDHFVQTGCFSPQDINEQLKEEKKDLLSVKTVVDLLVYLNIAVEVPSHLASTTDSDVESTPGKFLDPSTSQSKKYYFLPAVLQTAKLPLLKRESSEELLPEPLCIRFQTGYLPLGFVSALTANLIATQNFQLMPFKSNDDQLITYKNKIRFRFLGRIDIILISGPKYCEFRVSKIKGETIEFNDSTCCPHIKTTICEAADRVTQSMQHGSLYKLSKGYELAFRCPRHQGSEIGHEPLARFVTDTSSVLHDLPKEISCVDSSCIKTSPLSAEMKMWFPKLDPPKIVKQPAIDGNRIVLGAQSTSTLSYKWCKDGNAISDDDVYKGSTTEELTIKVLSSRTEGRYMCLVKNNDGETPSDDVEYDIFVELKRQKLSDDAVLKLKETGIASIEDLESLTEEDLDELQLKKIERRKVERLRSPKTKVPSKVLKGESHPHLNSLSTVLFEIRSHWYLLGIQLEIDHPTLEEIRKDHKEATDKCFYKVLFSFLSNKGTSPSSSSLVKALQAPCLARSHLIDRIPSFIADSLDKQLPSTASRKRAILLKVLVNVLWDVRADWERIAQSDVLISVGTIKTIKEDYPDTGERFAAFLHKHLLNGEQDPNHLEKLEQSLRDESVGRHDVANILKEKIQQIKELF